MLIIYSNFDSGYEELFEVEADIISILDKYLKQLTDWYSVLDFISLSVFNLFVDEDFHNFFLEEAGIKLDSKVINIEDIDTALCIEIVNRIKNGNKN